MDGINKIKRLLKDFTQFEPESDYFSKFKNIITGNYNPPAYIVEMLLIRILGFDNYGEMDKVSWHTFLKFKGYSFMVRDYKFGTWTIEGLELNEDVFKIAEEIKAKIIKASKLLNKVLYNELKSEVEKGNFYLNNVCHKLSSILEFYKKSVLENLEHLDKLKKNSNLNNFVEILNERTRYENIISICSFSLILSFFSLLEFILDVMYAFEQPRIDFFNYRKRSLKERFKLVFDISKNKELKKLYDEIINLKGNYRNPLTHGLTNEVGLLVPSSYYGLIPLSYEYLMKEIHYGPFTIGKEHSIKIISIIEKFLNFIKNENAFKFYMLYLEYGFPIPIEGKEVDKIKKEMTTHEDFKEYLSLRSEYEN